MAKILLVDLDSKIPNLALMKLSTYHKKLGDEVAFQRYKISGYGVAPPKPRLIDNAPYDKTYCSIVFERNKGAARWTAPGRVVTGGSGHCLEKKLPLDIDCSVEDYSLYPDNNRSYGFITRGCIRNCPFCSVPAKEGRIHLYRHPRDIIRHRTCLLLDNNFLAYEGHMELLRYLVRQNVAIQFNQGLDIRLLTKESAELLCQMKRHKELIFAFDNVAYEQQVTEGYELIRRWDPRPWQVKMFVLVGWDSTIAQDRYRIDWMLQRKIMPYVMRHQRCFESPNKDFYTDLAAWTNQNSLIKKMGFEEFLRRRCAVRDISEERRARDWSMWNDVS